MFVEVGITTPYITLGQFLKLVKEITNGGEAKQFLLAHQITVNGQTENRRGCKLYPSDKIVIDQQKSFTIIEKSR